MTILQKEFKKKTFASVCNLVGAQICKLKNNLSGENPNHYPSLTPAEVLWRHYPLDFKCFWLFPPFFFGQEGGGMRRGPGKKWGRHELQHLGFVDYTMMMMIIIRHCQGTSKRCDLKDSLSARSNFACTPISQSMGGLPYLILYYYFFGGVFKKNSHISKYGRPTICQCMGGLPYLEVWGPYRY